MISPVAERSKQKSADEARIRSVKHLPSKHLLSHPLITLRPFQAQQAQEPRALGSAYISTSGVMKARLQPESAPPRETAAKSWPGWTTARRWLLPCLHDPLSPSPPAYRGHLCLLLQEMLLGWVRHGCRELALTPAVWDLVTASRTPGRGGSSKLLGSEAVSARHEFATPVLHCKEAQKLAVPHGKVAAVEAAACV